MKVALVHDYLVQYGGAERVLEEFSALFPNAPIYTLIYDAEATGHAFEGRDIRTSYLQRMPKKDKLYRLFPLLMPMAIEGFDLSGYDLVLSSSASFAKGVISGGDGLHICYCHTPMRYAWLDHKQIAGDSIYPSFVSKAIPMVMPYMRFWDNQSAQRPDHYLCNSSSVQRKIKKFYGRDSEIVYPPLDFQKFNTFSFKKPKEHFLIVGRMVPYKRFDLAIKAFNELKLPLTVVGSGPEYNKLKEMAGSTIEFTGLISEDELAQYYATSKALIFPQEEDFGITALESMAAGRPVIAYKKGGALESIKEPETGIFFDEQTVESLMDAVIKFKKMKFDSRVIQAHAKKFDRLEFRKQITDFVKKKLEEDKKLIRT
ncbi:MAG: glycosyltransferase [Candidatus Spechtbacterales bacterium]|nr:glycosyltransferase [Candidatus Spechtbacterales bacterium]